MKTKKTFAVTGGALWISKTKTESFKVLLKEIEHSVGGCRAARAFIPLSGKSYDLVRKGEVTEGTARRIVDANKRITLKKEKVQKDAELKLTALFD
jgi:hypothetical protein